MMNTRRQRGPIVDCDIHNAIPSGALRPYLPQRWRDHEDLVGMRGHQGSVYPKGSPGGSRADAWPPSGLPPGGDLEFMRKQLLDAFDIEFGMLNCLSGAGSQLNPEFSAALTHAVNDWQAAEWLEPEPRLRAGVTVPQEHPDLAVAEIDRMGDHPGFGQVLLSVRTTEPLGRRRYWPLYEAAVRHDLPIGIHFGGGVRGNPISAAGWPSYYIEDHTGMAQSFQAQVVSLVCEGVFERFPTMRIVLIEGGFAWLPALMWRLDKHWNRLKAEVPHLTRPPSYYIRKHIWFTTQPMEEPPNPRYLIEVLDHFGSMDKVMFATDYPHWDFDDPDRALPAGLSKETRERIFSGNARDLYGL